MPRYLPMQKDSAGERVVEVYEALEKQFGSVPVFFKAMGASAGFLGGVFDLYKVVLGDCSLNEKVRSLIVAKVARVLNSKVGIAYSKEYSRQSGWTDEQIEAVDDYRASNVLSTFDKEVIEYAEGISRDPSKISNDLFTQLSNHFPQIQVVEMTLTAAFFNLIFRYCEALQVEPEQ